MFRWVLCTGLFVCCLNTFGANFGTVVPIRGTVSDVALDEGRGRLYIANFAAYQINVMNTGNQSFGTPMPVPYPPSSVALSPDGHYLVVGEDNIGLSSTPGGVTIFDLNAGQRMDIAMTDPVLAVRFGAGSQALLVTATQLLLLDPVAGATQPVAVPAQPFVNACLPVPFATFPPNISQAAMGVSGDGNTIVAALSLGTGANTGSGSASNCPGLTGTAPTASSTVAVISYSVGGSSAVFGGWISSPTLGPRAVSVDQAGLNYVTGWVLSTIPTNAQPFAPELAQFPAPTGVLNVGGHAWDWAHNRIFAQVPAAGDNAVMHVVDTDNLTVRERIQLAENLAGPSVWSSDGSKLYAVSISGVTIFPMGSFDQMHRVTALQEDVLFQSNACNPAIISKTIDVADLGGGRVDFSLSLPANTPGIRLTPSSGTTPARVRIDVDPTAFQASKGTTAVPLTISSSGSINLGATVRLLIATPDVNQHGRIIDVPGKITDMLTDRVRKRVYLTRQDKNQILVYDTTTFQQIGSFRTGNTPVGMAITTDQKYLIAGADDSQIDTVYDLDAMQQLAPIVLPGGFYGRSLAVASNGQIFQIVRSVTTLTPPNPPCSGACVVSLNLATGLASPPQTLGIYANALSSPDGVLAETPGNNTILMALADGTVVLYDATAGYSGEWVASRKDFSALTGAAGAFNANQFLVDNHVLDAGLAPVANLETTTGASSGVGAAAGAGLRTTSSAANAPGQIERVDLGTLQTYNGTRTDESPVVPSILNTPPVGQIGQTILSFVRSVAVPADQSSILLLTESGLTVLENNFDAPTPMPAISAVVNSADGTAGVAPGGLITVIGNGLAPAGAAATQLPLPEFLGNVCVTAAGTAVPLFTVANGQISAQLPFSVSGAAPLVVRTPGGISNPFTVNVQSFAPAIFRDGQAGDQSGIATVVRNSNNELVTFTNPIHPDEMITIYLTGLAQTSPQPDAGAASPSSPPASVVTPPTVTLGNVTLPVTFAGLVPGEVGVYQIDAYVPRNLQNADASQLTVTQGQATTAYSVRTVNP